MSRKFLNGLATTALQVGTATTAGYVLTGDASGNASFQIITTSAPRTVTAVSNAAPTPNTDVTDEFDLTAQAATAAFANPTGTPLNGQKLLIRIKDNGTAQAITWGTLYISSGAGTLLTTTIATKTHMSGFIYNSASVKWVAMAVDATGY